MLLDWTNVPQFTIDLTQCFTFLGYLLGSLRYLSMQPLKPCKIIKIVLISNSWIKRRLSSAVFLNIKFRLFYKYPKWYFLLQREGSEAWVISLLFRTRHICMSIDLFQLVLNRTLFKLQQQEGTVPPTIHSLLMSVTSLGGRVPNPVSIIH